VEEFEAGAAGLDPHAAMFYINDRLDHRVVSGDDLHPAVAKENLAWQWAQLLIGFDVILQQSLSQFLAAALAAGEALGIIFLSPRCR